MIETVRTSYGAAAAAELHAAIASVKGDDALAPVTVIAPTNHVGVAARRRLGSGLLGPVTSEGVGVAGVNFTTTYRLGEMLGAPRLAVSGRRPMSPPVIGAAVRQVLSSRPGIFEPVAGHPTTERSLVQAHRELREVPPEGLDALAAQGRRASEVIRVHREVTAFLSDAWYDEVDLLAEAVEALAAGSTVVVDLGPLVLYLPQIVRPSAAALIRAYGERRPVSAIVGLVGDARADEPIERSLRLLGAEPPGGGPVQPPVTARVRVVDTSDADDEVRQVVRGIVEAARRGVKLERMAVLYAATDPYARTLHEQLTAAGIAYNGAAVQTAATSLLGRSLLGLLALPDGGFRRDQVMAWLASSPVHDRGRLVPASAWERVSRRAGVVGGASQWVDRLDQYADDRRAAAERDEVEGAGRADRYRREAEWAESLRRFIEHLARRTVPAGPLGSWTEAAAWVRRLVETYLGDETVRASWPEVEQSAAERIDAALERLAGLDAVDLPPSPAVFRRTLELELDSGLGRVGRLGEGVLTGRLELGLGVDLDELFVVGVAEGTLPSRGREDSLLPDRDRAVVAELAPRGERVDDEHRQFLAAVAAADAVTLIRARGDLRRNVDRVGSRWIPEVCRGAAVESTTVASFASTVTGASFPATVQEYNLRTLAAAGRDGFVDATHPDVVGDVVMARGYAMVAARASGDFTRFDGNLAGSPVADPADPRVVTSPTRLEAWARWPFVYFMEQILHVQPLERPEALLTISALDRGNIVHGVLEQFVQSLLDGPAEAVPSSGQRWSEADHRFLLELGAAECDRFEARGLTGKAVFWRRDRGRLLADLTTFLASDEEHRREWSATPAASELAFGVAGGREPVEVALGDGRRIRFRGSADRVDRRSDGGLVVIDYKTGRYEGYHKLGPADPHQGGTRLQLGVYAHAARMVFGDPATPVYAGYWFVSRSGGFRWAGYEVSPEIEQQITDAMTIIADGIGSGAFPAYPADLDFMVGRYGPSADPYRLSTTECRTAWLAKRDDPALSGFRALAESGGDHV